MGELQFEDHSSIKGENSFFVRCLMLPHSLILPRLSYVNDKVHPVSTLLGAPCKCTIF